MKVVSETNNIQKKIKFEALMYIICGCILSMGAIHMDTINWILPQVATDLASGHSTLMVTSGFFYGMMIGHVVVGPLSDMIGKKKVVTVQYPDRYKKLLLQNRRRDSVIYIETKNRSNYEGTEQLRTETDKYVRGQRAVRRKLHIMKKRILILLGILIGLIFLILLLLLFCPIRYRGKIK